MKSRYAAGRVVSNRRAVSMRRGSALILVLVMTLSLAGLAVSAVLLTSSSTLVQRYYDKAKDYRLYALSAIGLVKSSVQRDTTIAVPGDTAYRALTASTITDADGNTNTTIRVNAYASYTGDTAGTYIPFLTIMAQAYDTLGVKSVQRLDLQSESFSRYAMFVDSFPTGLSFELGQHLRGRVHGNRNWQSTVTGPGPDYYDTVSAASSVTGTASYHGITAVSSAKRIGWPTTTSLSRLTTLASAGRLSFAPVAGTWSRATSSGTDLSGANSAANARRGTRLRFRPIDVNNNGAYDAEEGFFELFDLAGGIDTAALRVDPVSSTAPANTPLPTHTALLNQCGLLVTIAGRREFYPTARFREAWVQARVRLSTAPIVSAADATTMGGNASGIVTIAAASKVLSFGVGYSRCFPAGSPYLMLTERYVDGSCTVDSTVGDRTYGWGSATATCGAGVQYGGQDTTFTPNASRCYIDTTTGYCSGNQVRLGSWRLFSSGGGTSTANPPATVLQAVETAYLWPISSTYNAVSRGVIYASGGNPLYVSDTVRGFVTLYTAGTMVLINDIVYDKDPLASDALCRNFLGLLSASIMRIASSAMNYPRRDPNGNVVFLGSPNFTLHAAAMTLSSGVAVEDSTITLAMTPAIACNGTNTSGGCFNHTGASINRMFRATNTTSANSGLIRNMTRDPCQSQSTNRRPPFFPLTGRYVDYQWLDADPRITSTWAQIKTYYSRLRGNNRKVP